MASQMRWERQILVGKIAGNIDEFEGRDFSAMTREMLGLKPAYAVLDCFGMTHIASNGIAMIIRFAQDIRGHGGQVRLIGVNPRLKGVLETVNVDRIVPIDDDLAAAARNFGI